MIVTWMPVTQPMLDDAEAVGDSIREMFRRIDLAMRGFLGLIRCQLCNRKVRCVYTIPRDESGLDYFRQRDQHFGRTCYQRVRKGIS